MSKEEKGREGVQVSQQKRIKERDRRDKGSGTTTRRLFTAARLGRSQGGIPELRKTVRERRCFNKGRKQRRYGVAWMPYATDNTQLDFRKTRGSPESLASMIQVLHGTTRRTAPRVTPP